MLGPNRNKKRKAFSSIRNKKCKAFSSTIPCPQQNASSSRLTRRHFFVQETLTDLGVNKNSLGIIIEYIIASPTGKLSLVKKTLCSFITDKNVVDMIMEYSKGILVKDLLLLVTNKNHSYFRHFRNLPDTYNSVLSSRWFNWIDQFQLNDPITSKQRQENFLLYKLLYAIDIDDTSLILSTLHTLILIVRENLQNLNLSLQYGVGASLVDLVMLLILIIECEWSTDFEKKQHRWRSFLLWVLFYLLNVKAVEHIDPDYSRCDKIVCSAFFTPIHPSIYSIFFNPDYECKISRIPVEEILKQKFIQQKPEYMGKESISNFVNIYCLKEFAKYRANACSIYRLCMDSYYEMI